MHDVSEKKEWIHDFFGGEDDFYSTVYRDMGVFDKKDPLKEIEGILNILKPEPGAHILDWCGGFGRHAVPLARYGFKVTLLDFSRRYLDSAELYAQASAATIKTVCADFRNTPPGIQADYAVNLFTAGLGYLGEENDIIALISLRNALKPGARILIDTMNLFWIVKNFKDNNWSATFGGTKRYLQKREMDFWTNTERASNIYQDTGAGVERKAEIALKLYCPADLSRVLKAAGFVPQELFGGFDGSEFTLDSKRLIMTAQKS